MERGTSPERHPWFGAPMKRQISKNYGRLGGMLDVVMKKINGQWVLHSAVLVPEE